MKTKIVYIVTDVDDSDDVHVFHKRENAIRYMYNKVQSWGGLLSTSITKGGITNQIYLDSLVGCKDEAKIYFLNSCSDSKLNHDIFYCYFTITTVTFDDKEDD